MANGPTNSQGQFNSATHEANDGMKRMGDDASRAKDHAVEFGKDVAHTAKSGAAAVKQEVTRGLSHAKDEVMDGVSKVKESGADAVDAVSDFVAHRPMTSIGIALGVGMVLGTLIGCRRS